MTITCTTMLSTAPFGDDPIVISSEWAIFFVGIPQPAGAAAWALFVRATRRCPGI